MKKTTYIIYGLLLCSLFMAAACSQYEIEPFTAGRGINFVKYNMFYKEYKDSYKELEEEHNFFVDYAGEKGWEADEHVFAVGVKLEGRFSDDSIKVKFKLLPVEGYEMPVLEVPDSCVINPRKSQNYIRIVCKKPEVYDRVYKARLVFDYAASGLVPGTKERQEYLITASDASDWKGMDVANEEEWNSAYAHVLGNYGPMKARFILVSFGGKGYPGFRKSYADIGREYAATKQGNGFNGYMQKAILSYFLELYKTEHGGPLTEPDGTIVKFNF